MVYFKFQSNIIYVKTNQLEITTFGSFTFLLFICDSCLHLGPERKKYKFYSN